MENIVPEIEGEPAPCLAAEGGLAELGRFTRATATALNNPQALEGKYTEPGPGGDPIRNPGVLPTGKVRGGGAWGLF